MASQICRQNFLPRLFWAVCIVAPSIWLGVILTEKSDIAANGAAVLVTPSVPSLVDLGVLNPGETVRLPYSLRNTGSKAIVFDHIETTCHCVSVSPDLSRVDPGKSAKLIITFNPTVEPDFRGALCVDCTGKSPDGSTAFLFRVNVVVSATPP